MSKLEKVRTHISENKAAYIAGGVGVVVGIAATTIVLKKSNVEVKPKIQQILSYKPNATLEVHIEALGDPGNIIQDTTTGIVYASQGQAARELGVSSSRISEQLRGSREHVNGHTFAKLGKAMVSED